jgi:hypothetical protein
MLAPFTLLYLRWENGYPDEWGAPDVYSGSPWNYKEGSLRDLGWHGVADEFRGQTADLTLTAIGRPYRCKDWMYALLVRHVADTGFHKRVTPLADARDPLTRLRVRCIFYLIDHPDERVTRTTWHRWLNQ